MSCQHGRRLVYGSFLVHSWLCRRNVDMRVVQEPQSRMAQYFMAAEVAGARCWALTSDACV